ncbi:MAG: slipin family protein [Bacteroidetes bacterium]|nr:slipin family protein [Bacteroidota bacterium]
MTRINIGTVGLVYRNRELVRVLQAGTHFVNPLTDTIEIVQTGNLYVPKFDLNILLRNTVFKQAIHLVEIADGQMCVVLRDKLYHALLGAGRYVYFKGLHDFQFVIIDVDSTERITDPLILKLADKHLSGIIRKLEVDSFEQSVLMINGEYKQLLTAGSYYFYKNSTRISISKVDLRLQSMEISGQEMLTKDKASLRVNFTLQYKVKDVRKAILENKDYDKQLYLVAQLLLREIIGSQMLDEILENKEVITDHVMSNIAEPAATLGVVVLNAGVKDIILPGDVKEIMNQVLVAQKQAQANVITRREEFASTRSLLNTAKLLEENTMLFRLKEMEYLEKIASRIGEVTVSGNSDMLKQLQTIFGGKE